MTERSTAPVTVVPKAYDLVLWLIPRVNEFPRAQRFILGERIENAALDLLDILTDAQYRRQKIELLSRANLILQAWCRSPATRFF